MADYSVRGNVAVIELNNPPVNALSHKVRSGLSQCTKRALADKNVTCIVVCGKNNVFSAGADIKEFAAPKSEEPWITDVGHELEASDKPIVAAIAGVALGGGLEIALFCHYRIALKNARVAFPEVQIGILPGACGTQRLPRVAGLKNALDMITTGNHVAAEDAFRMGIIDKLVTGDIINEGVKFAQSVVRNPLDNRRLRYRKVQVPGDLGQISEAALAKVKTKYRGFIAPINCVRSVIASCMDQYEAGVKKEMELFAELNQSSQARAQQYTFFAERAINKWQLPSGGNYLTAKPIPVHTSAVIGAGTMGSGIALSLITSGFPCIMVEQKQEFLDNGFKILKEQLAGTVRLKKMTEAQAKKALSLLTPTINIEKVKDVDVVIEAVFENLELKREIFGKLDKICKPSTILCTNTSTIEIDKIATATQRQDKVVGTHFFAPAYIMKLLENIYGSETSAETVATVMKLGKDIKKIPVLVGSCDGFVANRMNNPYKAEAVFMVEEGASPQAIDMVWKDFGLSMGPFQVSDLSGLDVGWRIRQVRAKALGKKLTLDTTLFDGQRFCSLTERLVEKHGRLGMKTGKGWFKYEKPGAKMPYVDADVTSIIEEHQRHLGITPRRIGSHEITERMLYSMINEGFKLLEEGICSQAEEIDIIMIYGFNWPKYVGGPMYHASKIGLKKVYERICYYHEKYPFSMHWLPSPLMKKVSELDRPLKEWGPAARVSKL